MASQDLSEDKRLDPRQLPLLQMLASMKGKNKPRALEDITKSHEELIKLVNSDKAKPILQMVEAQMMNGTPMHNKLAPKDGLDIQEGWFTSHPDNNKVRYILIRPTSSETLPCVVYFHGGGMVQGSCFYSHYRAFGRLIAHSGVCVCLVDFRNALIPGLIGDKHAEFSSGQVKAYPGGLNDCVSSIGWLRSQSSSFNIDSSRIVLAGESGGGNLAIATALKLQKSGHGSSIAGIYALCPFILGNYPDKRFSSTIENNGIMLSLDGSAPHLYGIEAYKRKDCLAWPIFAKLEDLENLPRVFVSLNECDPLRDEGLEFYRKCLAAGVSTQCRIVAGTAHGGELFFTMPEVTVEAARSIAHFATGAAYQHCKL